MNSTKPAKTHPARPLLFGLSLLAASMPSVAAESELKANPGARSGAQAGVQHPSAIQTTAQVASLSQQQVALIPIAAYASAGQMPLLHRALHQGLDAGLTISEIREVLLQLYAYAGFPRSLNALTELMQVVEARQQQGRHDAPGRAPSRPIPTGDALLAAGTANQTRLAGGPVGGALFDFAPDANTLLRTHLFGDLFERDNLDWHSRELATVSMLAALPGAEAQLQAHMRISLNIGLSPAQLQQLSQELANHDADMGARASSALRQQLANSE